jgi:hypothetical protein
MKKYFIRLFFSFLSSSFYAQHIPFTIQKSETFKDEYKQSVFVLAEKDSKGGMLFARYYESGGVSPGDGLYIEKYSANLKLEKEFDFKTEHLNFKKYETVVGVFAAENIIHVITIYYDLNEKAVICQSNNITADFKTSQKELFRLTRDEIQSLGSFSMQQISFDRSKEMWSNSNSGDIKTETDLSKPESTFPRIDSNIFMVVNESKTAFAIALDMKQPKSKELKLYLFDNNLQKKIDTHFTRDVKDDKYIFENVQVSENGNAIYVMGKSYAEELRKKKVGGKYFFELTKVTATSQKIARIDTNEHFIGYLKPFLHNNEIICLGFFSDLDDKNYTGICHLKADADLSQLTDTKYNPFTKRFILDKYGEKKEYKALTNLTFRNIFFTTNNDIIINAEEEEIWTSSSGVGIGVGTKTKITYNYDDVASFKLNAKGELLWARNINKNQTRSDEDNFYISYSSLVKNDATYLFINASDKIRKLKDDRIEFGQVSKDKSNLNLIKINSSGEWDYQEILEADENAMPFMVSKGIVIDNSVYFLGRKGKDKQLLKITL